MTKSAQVRWDDLAIILAVVEHGSVAAAARALSVNHATVLRRIADFETRTAVRLFDKTTRGYQISPDRQALVAAMRDAMQALGAVEKLIDHARPKLEGGVRITTTDTLAQFILPQVLSTLDGFPDAPVEVMVDNAHVDFSRMQAQLTVRPAAQLPPELDGLPAGRITFAVYGVSEDPDLPWLGLTGPLARTVAAEWVRERPPGISAFGDSFLALAAMASEGTGRTILPDYVGQAFRGLICLQRPPDLPTVPIWVGAHVDYGRTRHVMRARKALATALAAHPALS